MCLHHNARLLSSQNTSVLLLQVLQFAQYMVVDQCDSKVNQLLTWLAYCHVSLQPIVFNEFVWGQPQAAFNKPVISKEADQVLHWTVRRLASVASGLLILKGLPALLQLLGLSAAVTSLLGGVLGSQAAGYLAAPAACCADNAEMLCGQQLCSISGKFHIGWSVPQLPNSYYIPTAFIHGFFFFVPALALGGLPQRVLGLAALLTGPVMTEVILGGDAEARRYEWASIWCMFSLGQVLLLIAVELLGGKTLLGRWSLPSTAEDTQPGSMCSDLLAPAKALQAARQTPRRAGKAATLQDDVALGATAGQGWASVLPDGADATADAVDAGGRGLRVINTGRGLAGNGGFSLQERLQLHEMDAASPSVSGLEVAGLERQGSGEVPSSPRRSVRLQQRSRRAPVA